MIKLEVPKFFDETPRVQSIVKSLLSCYKIVFASHYKTLNMNKYSKLH
jgi:hypothetical protein